MNVLDGIFIHKKAVLSIYKHLLFSVATFVNYTSWIVWMTCCSLCISTCYPAPCTFMLRRQLLSLNLINQPLLASDFTSTASSPLSAFVELKRVRTFCWTSLWLKRMLWLVRSSIQIIKISVYISNRRFHFLIIGVFTGVALFTSFKNFPFAYTAWLIVWHKRPSFQPVSTPEVPSSLSLTISSF